MFYETFVRLSNSIGKSPSAVALDCGLKKSTVTKWKQGGNPTDATARKIADYFGVSVDYLFRGDREFTVSDAAAGKEKSPTPDGEGEGWTDYEREAIEALRLVPDEKKPDALKVIRALGEDTGLLKKP